MTNTNVISNEKETTTGIPTPSILLWLGIGSMIMLFGGLLSGYIVRRAEGNWDSFALPFQFTISTIVIVLGSITVQWALFAIKRNQKELSRIMLIATLGLSFFFVFFSILRMESANLTKYFFRI
ncbi:MAG: hypothetical protein IPO27_03740 [Bacteroidetes bacterium]|nr:hypothetical protein [Bacteroidota bacterium]